MDIKEYYIMTPSFMHMTGHYDRQGKTCSEVTELARTFIVNRSPLEIINDSIRCIGFDLKGALSTSKWILGDRKMCPVMVNPILNICVFPDKSPNHEDSIWFNPYHIIRTNGVNRKTMIEFRNGYIMKLPATITSFNDKWAAAEQLRNITVEIATNPLTFVLTPQNKRLQLEKTSKKKSTQKQ